MFLGVYWAERPESREEAAQRVAAFLAAAAAVSPVFAQWLPLVDSEEEADRAEPVVVSAEALSASMTTNDRDTDGTPIVSLGFSIGLWNREESSFRAHVGSYADGISNSMVLELGLADGSLRLEKWRELLRLAVAIFDPDRGVVSSHEMLARAEAKHPCDAGWVFYRRGDQSR